MFFRRPKRPFLRFVGSAEERRLTRALRESTLENAYLLGLLSDFTLRGLHQMAWGRFYRYGEWNPCEGIFYLDTTGLLVPTQTSADAIAAFLRTAATERLLIGRIIGAQRWVAPMEQSLSLEPALTRKVRQRFPEIGMVLEADRLTSEHEPRLRLAQPMESERIAESSVQAMAEELNLATTTSDYDRLLSSKRDLIRNKRYYVLEENGRFHFQAYLSAFTREVSQIQGVYVPPEFRGQGIATRCVAEMCRQCFAKTDRIVLRVQKRNLPAIAVYRKVGFRLFMDYLSVWYEKQER